MNAKLEERLAGVVCIVGPILMLTLFCSIWGGWRSVVVICLSLLGVLVAVLLAIIIANGILMIAHSFGWMRRE